MRIFIAAFDWGLGHTTRIVPVIHQLLCEGHVIIIGASDNQLPLYKEHFPELQYEKLPSFQPRLSKSKTQLWAIALYIPRFLTIIRIEHFLIKRIARKHAIEKIISDNRYGLYLKKVQSVFITHQLNVLLPARISMLQGFVNGVLHRYINKFNNCLVPDYSGAGNLSGKLSHPIPTLRCSLNFTGPLSRFEIVKEDAAISIAPELLIIISGPEKQRTCFENAILTALDKSKKLPHYLIIRGLPHLKINELPDSISYANASTLKTLINKAKYIICRSGYSIVMDLIYLGKTAMLVPTPGQTEQEYLAQYLEGQGYFLSEKQENLNLDAILERLSDFTPGELFSKRFKNPPERLPFKDFL